MPFRRSSAIPKNLKNSRLGDRLPTSELRQLTRIGTVIDISDGDQIIAEATLGRECFVIVDGEFSVSSASVSATVGSGDVAGELALLTGKTRNATVTATSDAAVFALHPREFATLLSHAPSFCAQVVEAATSRLDDLQVTLPAQFVRRPPAVATTPMPWSAQLSSAPRWRPLDD